MAITRSAWRYQAPAADVQARTAIGVALRRDSLDVVVSDDAAAIQARVSLPATAPTDVTHGVPRAIRTLLVTNHIAASTLLGIGISLPAPREVGQHATTTTLPSDTARLDACLRQEFGVPTFLDTHINMGTLGESRYGMGRAVDDMLYVSLGATIRAGIIMNGRLYHGGAGMAGAIGHMAIDPQGALCSCGQRGCLQTSAGAAAIVAAAQRQGCNASTLDQVATAAASGDAGCRVALERAGVALGTALTNVVVMLNPAMIVLGGATMGAGDLLLAPLRQTILRHHRIARHVPVQIVQSMLGTQATALGGIAAVLDALATRRAMP